MAYINLGSNGVKVNHTTDQTISIPSRAAVNNITDAELRAEGYGANTSTDLIRLTTVDGRQQIVPLKGTVSTASAFNTSVGTSVTSGTLQSGTVRLFTAVGTAAGVAFTAANHGEGSALSSVEFVRNNAVVASLTGTEITTTTSANGDFNKLFIMNAAQNNVDITFAGTLTGLTFSIDSTGRYVNPAKFNFDSTLNRLTLEPEQVVKLNVKKTSASAFNLSMNSNINVSARHRTGSSANDRVYVWLDTQSYNQ